MYVYVSTHARMHAAILITLGYIPISVTRLSLSRELRTCGLGVAAIGQGFSVLLGNLQR